MADLRKETKEKMQISETKCSSCDYEGIYDVCECCSVYGTANDLEKRRQQLKE